MKKTKYSIFQMVTAFDFICDQSDWKNEINCVIPANQKDLVKEAIWFYTATEAKFVPAGENQNGPLLTVSATGYHNGPAGP